MAPDGEAPNPAFRSRWALVLLAAALLAGGLAGAAGAGLLGTGDGAQVAEGGAEAEAVAVAEAGSELTPTSSPPASFPPSEPVPLTGLQRKDMFGTAVALSADGSVLAASAPYAAGDRGQVSAFLRQGNETDGGEGGSAVVRRPQGEMQQPPHMLLPVDPQQKGPWGRSWRDPSPGTSWEGAPATQDRPTRRRWT